MLGALIVNLLSGLSFVASAVGDPTFAVEETVIITGDETATVPVTITDNPGIWCSQLFILYDSSISFVSVDTANSVLADKSTEISAADVTINEAKTKFFDFEDLLAASGNEYDNAKVVAVTIENNALDNIEEDGAFFNLIFNTALAESSEYPIDVLYSHYNTLNVDDEKIGFTALSGSLFVVDELADYCSVRGHEFVDGERYCLHGCGAENPDYNGGYKVICDGDVIGEYEAGENVTLPTLSLSYDKYGTAYRFFTWSGADVVRGKYSADNETENGRVYTMTMPESDVELTAVYSLIGDVNGDDRINSKDLSALKKVISSALILDDAGNDRADLDGNDRNNSKDVSAMKRMLAGSYTVLK